MIHPSLKELLAYVDGELAPNGSEHVASHVESCAVCSTRLSELSAASAAIDESQGGRSKESWTEEAQLRAAFRARLAEVRARAHPQKQSMPLWSRSVAYAAGLLILTAMGALFVQRHMKLPERAALPNPAFTPGAVRQVSLDELCVVNDDEVVRVVPAALQERVFHEYGLSHAQPGDFELDYLITPGLGGSDDVANLWPQPHASRWNSYVKDQLEDHLHHMVCQGQISLPDAQRAIASNWIDAYKRYFHTQQPLAQRMPAAPEEARVQRVALLRKHSGL